MSIRLKPGALGPSSLAMTSVGRSGLRQRDDGDEHVGRASSGWVSSDTIVATLWSGWSSSLAPLRTRAL